MFTGIIEEVGTIVKIEPIQGGIRIGISGKLILDEIKIGDSISINGVCLTVTKFDSASFIVEAVGETLKKSTIENLRKGSSVNLERALRLSDRLGGHIVQGHVNDSGKIESIKKLGDNYQFEISFAKELSKYIAQEGSIAIDGISLTVAKKLENSILISIIPHTWNNTNLQYKKVAEYVNLEVDIIAKYLENILINKDSKSKITGNWLKDLGY